MANNLSGNPIFLDTASANFIRSGTAAAQATKGPLWISSIVWSGYTQQAHTAVFVDANGNAIFSFIGRADLTPINIDFDQPLRLRDFKLTALGSGAVAVNLT